MNEEPELNFEYDLWNLTTLLENFKRDYPEDYVELIAMLTEELKVKKKIPALLQKTKKPCM